MDYVITGRFIQSSRKLKGLTQKDLAEKLGVSDKTVSKWETGRGIPDISLLEQLCTILDVSINELLSGEKIVSGDYSGRAEKNMLELLEINKNYRRKEAMLMVVGIILMVTAVFFIIISNFGITFWTGLSVFFDSVSILALALLLLSGIFICRTKGSHNISGILKKLVLPIGAAVTLFLAEGILLNVNSLDEILFLRLAVAALPMLYSVIIYTIVSIIVIKREEKRDL